MITPSLNADGFTGHILIEPNRPINWQDNIRFIKIFSLLSFAIGAIAMVHGWFLIMPFSGLEVILLWGSLCLVYKRYSTCQVIYFTADSVIIETGKNTVAQSIEYQRYWSRFQIDNQSHFIIPRLNICAKGKSTEIGGFLNYDEKLNLINQIKTLTIKFRTQNQNS